MGLSFVVFVFFCLLCASNHLTPTDRLRMLRVAYTAENPLPRCCYDMAEENCAVYLKESIDPLHPCGCQCA